MYESNGLIGDASTNSEKMSFKLLNRYIFTILNASQLWYQLNYLKTTALMDKIISWSALRIKTRFYHNLKLCSHFINWDNLRKVDGLLGIGGLLGGCIRSATISQKYYGRRTASSYLFSQIGNIDLRFIRYQIEIDT